MSLGTYSKNYLTPVQKNKTHNLQNSPPRSLKYQHPQDRLRLLNPLSWPVNTRVGVHLVTLYAKFSTCTPDIQRFKKMAWFVGGTKQTNKNGDVTGSISKINPQNPHENLRCASCCWIIIQKVPFGEGLWPPQSKLIDPEPNFLILLLRFLVNENDGEAVAVPSHRKMCLSGWASSNRKWRFKIHESEKLHM